MADPTTNYGWDLPNVGGDIGSWGTIANTVFQNIDTKIYAMDAGSDKRMVQANPTGTGVLYITGAAAGLRVDDRSDPGVGNAFESFASVDKWRVFAHGTSKDIIAIHENGRAELTTATMGVSIQTVTGAINLDLSVANVFYLTTSGNITISFTNVPSGTLAVSVIVRIFANGSHTVTWPAAVKWPGGTDPVQTVNSRDLYALISADNGTTWEGVRVGRDLS